MDVKRKLNKLKYVAYESKKGGCLPLFLYKKIISLDNNSDDSYIRYLMFLSEYYLRPKKFYIRYAELHEKANNEIKILLEERGYIQ